MTKPDLLNINEAANEIVSACALVERVSRDFLQENPHSARVHGENVNRESALKAMSSALEILIEFHPESKSSDQRKKSVYLNFLASMDKLAKAPGSFADALTSAQVMEKLCHSIGKVFAYHNPEDRGIRQNVHVHIDLMRGNWFQLQPQSRFGLNVSNK